MSAHADVPVGSKLLLLNGMNGSAPRAATAFTFLWDR